MRCVSEILEQNPLQQAVAAANNAAPSRWQQLEQTSQVINSVVTKLLGMGFRNSLPDGALDEYRRQMTLALFEAGINSQQQIKLALRKARTIASDNPQFAPPLPPPGSFVRWCKPDPADLGMPDVISAHDEAAKHIRRGADHDWSHAAVWMAARQMGWELRSQSHAESLRLFKPIYQRVCEQLASGDIEAQLPSKLALPPAPPHQRVTDLNEIRRLLALGSAALEVPDAD